MNTWKITWFAEGRLHVIYVGPFKYIMSAIDDAITLGATVDTIISVERTSL